MLRELTPERSKVGDAMIWCLDHAESAEEVVECISESLSILQTPIPKKVRKLFTWISTVCHMKLARLNKDLISLFVLLCILGFFFYV